MLTSLPHYYKYLFCKHNIIKCESFLIIFTEPVRKNNVIGNSGNTIDFIDSDLLLFSVRIRSFTYKVLMNII